MAFPAAREVTFRSSRGAAGAPVDFRQALLQGMAPDGGLYVPETVPPLPPAWESAGDLPTLAADTLEPWIGEPRDSELRALLRDALDFPVPVVGLSEQIYVVELFHGPTLSFKDFGARTMARLMDRYLAGQRGRLTILVATSGDTGSAVADGFAGLDNLRVVLLYPKGRVSDVQERQLTVRRPGVRAVAVRGTFDDCQRLVKEAFTDPALKAVRLSSANSINVGRLLPQMIYYLWAAGALRRLEGDAAAPVVSVPSGNLGNLTAGLLAHRAGLPVRTFVAAHNANRFFPDYLSGIAAAYEFPETEATASNAMDVGAPSNFERIVTLFGDRAAEQVWGTSVDDEVTSERMRKVYETDGYVACPHTAVGLEAVARYRAANGEPAPALVLATAHPAKFPAVVRQALGREAPASERLERLLEAPAEALEIAPEGGELRQILLEGAESGL